jgi:hypothetical protein
MLLNILLFVLLMKFMNGASVCKEVVSVIRMFYLRRYLIGFGEVSYLASALNVVGVSFWWVCLSVQ